MLLKCFGEFWNPAIIDWSKEELLGHIKDDKHTYEIDFWGARGVYVLYENFRPIYVGKSEVSIGDRIAKHLGNRLAGRWDMFSWYSPDKINKTTCTLNRPNVRNSGISSIIKTFESIIILSTAPPLNRKYENIPGAQFVKQKDNAPHKSTRQYLQEISSGVSDLRSRTAGK